MNNLTTVKLLSNSMWLILMLAYVMSYCGLHPQEASTSFLFL